MSGWVPPPSKPLDEAAWCAWVEKGRMRDSRTSEACLNALRCALIVGLLAEAAIAWRM